MVELKILFRGNIWILSLKHSTSRSVSQRGYFCENESFSKTILACLVFIRGIDGLDHRISIQQEGKRGGRGLFFLQIEPNWPLSYLRDAEPADWVICFSICTLYKYIDESPKQGSRRFNSIVKTTYMADLGIVYLWVRFMKKMPQKSRDTATLKWNKLITSLFTVNRLNHRLGVKVTSVVRWSKEPKNIY